MTKSTNEPATPQDRIIEAVRAAYKDAPSVQLVGAPETLATAKAGESVAGLPMPWATAVVHLPAVDGLNEAREAVSAANAVLSAFEGKAEAAYKARDFDALDVIHNERRRALLELHAADRDLAELAVKQLRLHF